jgi:hypothetical protein
MKKIKIFVFVGLLLASCGGIKKDYVVVDVAYTPQPKWMKKLKNKASADSEYKYFISSADNVNQRLCEKTAKARVNSVIAGEIATELNDTYRSVTESKNDDSSDAVIERLEQNVKLYLSGVENEDSYWEKRKYLRDKGAEKDLVKYQCYSLVKMNRKIYNDVLRASIEKMVVLIQGSNKDEIKEKMSEKLLDNSL